MLTLGERKIAGPGTGAQPPEGRPSFRRILVPVRPPGQAHPALAAAARICGMTGGMLHLVHVRTSGPPQPISDSRFYLERAGEATAVSTLPTIS